jgi:hypothetical protein
MTNNGVYIKYDGKEIGGKIKSISIDQQIDALSLELPVSTCNIVLEAERDAEYQFEKNKPVEIWYKGKLMYKTRVQSSQRKNKREWALLVEDYVAALEKRGFYGDVYFGENVGGLLETILRDAGIENYEIDSSVSTRTISGHIPYTDCREALMMVLFATGAFVDTSGEKFSIKSFGNFDRHTITKGRIMQGQRLSEKEADITKVELTRYRYIVPSSDKKIDLYNIEEALEEDLFVKFSRPIYDNVVLMKAEGSDATETPIANYGANYAVIPAKTSAGMVLRGRPYARARNIIRVGNANGKTATIESELSSNAITAEDLAQRCYDYLSNTKELNMKVVQRSVSSNNRSTKYGERKYGTFRYGELYGGASGDSPIKVGDVLESETEFSGSFTGRVVEQKFNLNGNILVKDITVR